MKEISGYFELELPQGKEYHQDALRLNTGRNAFEYILRAKEYKMVYLPYYTCEVMLEPINKLSLDYEYYSIDKSFRPIFDFSQIKPHEVFVYTNYFGICDEQVIEVVNKCKNLIIDNSQAFFSKPLPDVYTFYSARKFFGVPDGTYLYTNKKLVTDLEQDVSYQGFEHLLGRIDMGAEKFYKNFKENEKKLANQQIKIMSKLTQKILESIDYKKVRKKRLKNFNFLHEKLETTNILKFNLSKNSVPMIYPLLLENGKGIKEKFIKNKIFVASYWPNIETWCSKKSYEYNLYENLVALPIDQRYGKKDMKKIVDIVTKFTKIK